MPYRNPHSPEAKISRAKSRKQWLAKNPDKQKEYREKYKEKTKLRRIARKLENVEEYKRKDREYRQRPEVRARIAAYRRERRSQDTLVCILHRCRNRIWSALKYSNSKKADNTIELLGCSAAELKYHIEKQFQNGMSWENRSDWHIDHIIPCSKFELIDPKEQRKCFHFSNLQPMWKADNIKKSNR